MKIKELIKQYLNSWIECYYCNYMCKTSIMTKDMFNNNICSDCNRI